MLGHRRGDNNQLLALAEGLGLPFETRSLEYNRFWSLLLSLFPARPYLLAGKARARLTPPWPDLVIGIGRRSVAVSRWIKKKSGGLTKIVRLGDPRSFPDLFDLVITTPQYPVASARNVLVLPVSMGRYATAQKPSAEELRWLEHLPRPHLLVSLGGTTRYWQLPDDDLIASMNQLSERVRAQSGSLIVATSPRTPASAIEAIKASAIVCQIVSDGLVRYPVLLADADENFVTADSVSMISEAVLAGKPVGLIPVELDEEGHKTLGTDGFSETTRDIRRFWVSLQSRGSVGTLAEPKSASIEDPVQTAAAAVKRLLGYGVQ